MAFIYEGKPVFRVYDPDRGFELGSGPGAHGSYTSYVHKMGDPDAYLGGGVEWEVVPLNMDNNEIDKATADNPIVTQILFKGYWRRRGKFTISGYDEKETLKIITDAIIKKHEMTQAERYKNRIIYKVITSSVF